MGSTDERHNLSPKGPGLSNPASALSIAEPEDERIEPRCFPLPLPLFLLPPLLPLLASGARSLCRGSVRCSPAHDHVTTAEGEPPERFTRGLVYILRVQGRCAHAIALPSSSALKALAGIRASRMSIPVVPCLTIATPSSCWANAARGSIASGTPHRSRTVSASTYRVLTFIVPKFT